MELRRLKIDDGSWDELTADWKKQCDEVGDDFASYASSSISVLKQAAGELSPTEWSVALQIKGRFMAAAWVNCTTQRGYVGKVLRIREVIVCPLLDYGTLSDDDYVDTLIGVLYGAVNLSETSLVAKHIKMHLRSPADRRFFRAVGNTLDSKGVFEATESHGAWLSFTKHSVVLRAI
jgi:hypothetical protein